MSIGRIIPVDSLAPKIRAIIGTIASPRPLSPAFDIPIVSADKINRMNKPGVRSGWRICRVDIILPQGNQMKGQIYEIDSFRYFMVKLHDFAGNFFRTKIS